MGSNTQGSPLARVKHIDAGLSKAVRRTSLGLGERFGRITVCSRPGAGCALDVRSRRRAAQGRNALRSAWMPAATMRHDKKKEEESHDSQAYNRCGVGRSPYVLAHRIRATDR